jgi:cyclic-di-AMP phosphodiesterase PgpH
MRPKLPSGLPPEIFSTQNWLVSPILLAVLAAAAAAFLMPQQSAFPYSFEKGQTWPHKTLKAPFDFEVLRPESEVRDELARIENEHGRYYLLDPDVARAQKRRFSQMLDEQVRISRNDAQYADLIANSGAYLTYGQSLLDQLYGRGVLAEADDFLADDPAAQVWLVGTGTEKRVPLASLLTPKSALGFLTDSLPFSPLRQPEFLLPLLEKTVAPNIRYSDSLTLAAKRRKIAEVVSTGITVRRGEKIVERDQIVTPEIAQKLHSLAQRFDEPKGWPVVLGYFLMAFLTLGTGFFFLKIARPQLWENRAQLLFLPATVLLAVLFVNFGGRVGVAVPLLLPVCAMPVLLARLFDREIGLGTWAATLFLIAFSLDWGIGWAAIQLVGGLSAHLLLPRTRTWQGRSVAAALMAASMMFAWAAAWLAGRLPGGAAASEVPFFLAVAAFSSLLAFPVGDFLSQKFSPTEPTNLPQSQ